MNQIYVGIDWADDHHDVHVTNNAAQVLAKFAIPHSYEGMEELKQRLAELCPAPERILVAMESHRGLLLYSLLEAGYQVYLINPKAVDRYRDRYRMSSSKSDPLDAMVLANILRTDLHLYKPLPKEVLADEQLQRLTRAHKSMGQERVRLANQLMGELKNYYPVVLQIFSDVDQKITLAFLERYPNPSKAAATSLKQLEAFFRKQHYCRPDKVPFIYESLHKPALKAPGKLEEIHQKVVLAYVQVLRPVLDQMDKLAKQIAAEFEQNPAYRIFSSLPTGEITAARLNGEIGSAASRYPTPEILRSTAGTAPETRRSGKTKFVCFRWQCNKHLRSALQDLARESVKRFAWAKDYFHRQLQAGHKKSRAYRALANRWAAIIWKMLQTGKPFNQALLAQRTAPLEQTC